MMWQDLVFLAGSVLSIVFLAPTVRDVTANIPLGSSVPSMTIGAIYAVTYATMGMRFSALGSLGVATMWSLIVCYRSPGPRDGPANVFRFARSLARRAHGTVTGTPTDDDRVASGRSAD
ncbi:hypothetical protein NP511_12125 [Natrinema thermotolerans]|uniref:Uncharacterized protein n=1 Tax=Natrinema thermotolerans TaxID=121872 RepID=A0AAF0P8U4_9EURY|nr:hypothetical protein [Natrinema thermotolerans]QCC59174.1 hypothetical protein DVR14_11260 [Natrinema thermotolerans]WMT06131.1 hypothetical protein NP511_12125 [Natrinema thermotolerans]